MSSILEMLIQQNGGQIFDDSGAVAINSPQCAEALATIPGALNVGATDMRPITIDSTISGRRRNSDTTRFRVPGRSST